MFQVSIRRDTITLIIAKTGLIPSLIESATTKRFDITLRENITSVVIRNIVIIR
jgi:hypothetical protein